MALNIPGLVVVVLFYLLVLGTGIWASKKSKRVERANQGNRSEVMLLGGRSINVMVGVFTMTGKWLCVADRLIMAHLSMDNVAS